MKITFEGLMAMVNRIKDQKQCKIAEQFVRTQAIKGIINNDEFDELMTSITWLYRDFTRRERHPEFYK